MINEKILVEILENPTDKNVTFIQSITNDFANVDLYKVDDLERVKAKASGSKKNLKDLTKIILEIIIENYFDPSEFYFSEYYLEYLEKVKNEAISNINIESFDEEYPKIPTIFVPYELGDYLEFCDRRSFIGDCYEDILSVVIKEIKEDTL